MEASGGPLDAGRRELSQRDRAVAGGAALLLLIGMPVAYLGGNTSTGDVIGLIVLTLVMLAAIAWVFLRLVPRHEARPDDAMRTGLILGVVAVIAVVVFWTGLPFPLGAGAIALGLVGQESAAPAAGKGRAVAAVVLGSIAIAIAFVALLFG
jgi:hypothetical protein